MMALEQRRLAMLAAADERPALVVVDVQRSFGDPEHIREFGLGDDDLAAVDAAVTRIDGLVASARQLGVPVFWVELASDPARPWRSSGWLRFADRGFSMESEPCLIGTPGAEWFRVAPAGGEPRFAKRGYSGFLGTGLEQALRAAGITWLTVAGLTTECCVSATAEDAFQLDWPVVVPRDASAAYERHLHENAIEFLAMNNAAIASGDEVVHLWRENGESR